MDTSSFAQSLLPRIEIRGVSKRFGSTAALEGVSLVAHAGSIHAVTGENGAGKSTLMKMLAGVHAPDEGEVWMDGRRLSLRGPAGARSAGISTVFQELTVLPNLSVAENITLGREPGHTGLLDRGAMEAAAADVLSEVGIDLDIERTCCELSVGEQQLLEIAKGIASEAQVFIFDEPTAPLNRAEVDKLETLLRRLAANGKLIFYISHRLEEIFRFCDTVTILKDGRHVATEPIGALTEDRLVSLMVGRPLQSLFPARRAGAAGDIALDAVDTSREGAGRRSILSLRRGEIVGLAGLEGQGQRELMRTLAGAERSVECNVVHRPVSGMPAASIGCRGTAAMVRSGVALVPEDRKIEGLYLDLSICDNLQLGLLRGRGLHRLAPRARKVVERLAEQLQLRSARSKAVGTLSGGNQQKVMIGRWLAAGVDTLLIEQPTRGVDVGAKAEIYRLLRQFADDGGAVLAVSGDLPELIGMCDRILVMRQRRIVADVAADGVTEEHLLALAIQDAPGMRGASSLARSQA